MLLIDQSKAGEMTWSR